MTDTDKIAEAFQSILWSVQHSDVSAQTMIVIEQRLQEVWAEVNDDVDSLEDIEEIYPDNDGP